MDGLDSVAEVGVDVVSGDREDVVVGRAGVVGGGRLDRVKAEAPDAERSATENRETAHSLTFGALARTAAATTRYEAFHCETEPA